MFTYKRALRVVAAAAVGGIVTFPTLVHGEEAHVMTVDLNLHTDSGIATLQGRIERAARLVCGPVDIKSTRAVLAYNLCHTAAIASAKPKMDAMIAAYRNGTAIASNAITVSP